MKIIPIAVSALLGGTVASAARWVEVLDSGAPAVRINEILADNVNAATDELGEHDDYIELYNPTDADVDLGGICLSDDPEDPTRWELPAGTLLPAGGRLLLWADGQPHQGPLHAPFRLSSRGEELGLYDTEANGRRYLDRIAFGPQRPDVAFGSRSDGSARRGELVPTPGGPNREPE